ncbi:MAG TPA: hypothetical protein PKL31_12335 [Fulvivirga sp.]|nr:hypothetical protein [Fulvivirga sp.]
MSRILFTITFVFTYLSVQAQELVLIKESQISISTIDQKQIRIQLIFDMPEGYEHSQGAFGRINQGKVDTKLVMKSKKELSITKLDAVMTPSNKGVGFRIDVDQEIINALLSGDFDYQFENQYDLYVIQRKVGSPTDTTRFKLSKEQIINETKNKLTLSEDDKTELVESLNGHITRTENTLDFGIIPSEKSDTDNTEFYASFSYQKGYIFPYKNPFFFSAKGIISTNSSDSLNYLSIYPVSYRIAEYDKSGQPKNYDLVAQLGIEGNQTFTNYRIAGNLYWQSLIPNLIDLTMGENRLRLKPVVKIGAKLYKEYDNNRLVETDNEDSNQVFGEIYYYIPIKKLYSLILDANAFYDFSESLNPNGEIKYNISATLGIDIPKTGFKTIFKYLEGENGITYQKDQLLMIGLMADLFSQK